VNDAQRAVPERCLRGGPRERGLRGHRAVDTDQDRPSAGGYSSCLPHIAAPLQLWMHVRLRLCRSGAATGIAAIGEPVTRPIADVRQRCSTGTTPLSWVDPAPRGEK
jgi:hypothetical protein